MRPDPLLAIASIALLGASSPQTTTFAVPLTGTAESNVAHPNGGTGDPDGGGSVRLTLNPATKQVCYDFELSGVSTPLMAHFIRDLR